MGSGLAGTQCADWPLSVVEWNRDGPAAFALAAGGGDDSNTFRRTRGLRAGLCTSWSVGWPYLAPGIGGVTSCLGWANSNAEQGATRHSMSATRWGAG